MRWTWSSTAGLDPYQMVRAEKLYHKMKVELTTIELVKPADLWQELLLSARSPTVEPNLNGVIRPNPQHQISAAYRTHLSNGELADQVSQSAEVLDVLSLSDLFRYVSLHSRQFTAEECAALRNRISAEELDYRGFLRLLA